MHTNRHRSSAIMISRTAHTPLARRAGPSGPPVSACSAPGERRVRPEAAFRRLSLPSGCALHDLRYALRGGDRSPRSPQRGHGAAGGRARGRPVRGGRRPGRRGPAARPGHAGPCGHRPARTGSARRPGPGRRAQLRARGLRAVERVHRVDRALPADRRRSAVRLGRDRHERRGGPLSRLRGLHRRGAGPGRRRGRGRVPGPLCPDEPGSQGRGGHRGRLVGGREVSPGGLCRSGAGGGRRGCPDGQASGSSR